MARAYAILSSSEHAADVSSAMRLLKVVSCSSIRRGDVALRPQSEEPGIAQRLSSPLAVHVGRKMLVLSELKAPLDMLQI